MPDICAQVDACFPAEGATADEFNACMYAAPAAGTIAAPDRSLLGGIPAFEGGRICEGEEGTTPAATVTATEAPAEPKSDASRDDGSAETPADTDATKDLTNTKATEAPAEGGNGDETDGKPEEDVANWEISALKESDASKYIIGALVPLGSSLLSILMA